MTSEVSVNGHLAPSLGTCGEGRVWQSKAAHFMGIEKQREIDEGSEDKMYLSRTHLQ
jgi:hypothetical protein